MTNIAIIYFSGTGHTHLMAEAMATGAQKSPDAKVQLLRIREVQKMIDPAIIRVILRHGSYASSFLPPTDRSPQSFIR
jgi:flavodoxin